MKIADSRISPLLIKKLFPQAQTVCPQNVIEFVGKSAKTYSKKHTTINASHRHKIQKGIFICNLKDLFYLKDFIHKISFEVSVS